MTKLTKWLLLYLACVLMFTSCAQQVKAPSHEVEKIPEKENTKIIEELVENKEIAQYPELETKEETEAETTETMPAERVPEETPTSTEEPIPKEVEPKPTEPPKEEQKPVEKQKAKTPTKVMNKIESVESFMKKPSQNDFGVQYENALMLYNAILNKDTYLKITFDVGNTTQNWEAQISFFDKFEKYVLHDIFNITRESCSGAQTYTELNPCEIYKEIEMINTYIDVVKSLKIDEYTEQKDAVIMINNYLCKKLNYQLSSNNPYQAFHSNLANCEGYARLFDRFCSIINVDCEYESGRVKTNGEFGLHAWNKVKLDSKWYYIDVCWNDSSNPNKYLLSETLWSDHSSQLYIDVKAPSGVPNGNKISYATQPTSITDLIIIPTEEEYEYFYEPAITLYNAIINNQDTTVVELNLNDEITDVYKLYDKFDEIITKKMFGGAFELHFQGISWRHEEGFVKATLNTGKIYNTMKETCENADIYHQANIKAGVKDGMSELEAIKKMVNWLSNQMTYESYASGSAIEALKTHTADFQWYAPIFQQMCRDAGIECEVIKGKHPYLAYWNRVKIGEKWYYSDVWYYFIESFANYESYEYFLSESLWSNHKIEK